MELRLITLDGLAFVGLHARTVLLISREALNLVDADEFVATIAHELGHDYFWDEYEEARSQRDYLLVQELELRCDGIAAITMDRLGVNSERFVSAVARLTTPFTQ